MAVVRARRYDVDVVKGGALAFSEVGKVGGEGRSTFLVRGDGVPSSGLGGRGGGTEGGVDKAQGLVCARNLCQRCVSLWWLR